MKQQPLTFQELEELGFHRAEGDVMEDGGFHRLWLLKVNSSEIWIIYEYTSNGKFANGYCEINCEKLEGRPITKADIQLLKEIL